MCPGENEAKTGIRAQYDTGIEEYKTSPFIDKLPVSVSRFTQESSWKALTLPSLANLRSENTRGEHGETEANELLHPSAHMGIDHKVYGSAIFTRQQKAWHANFRCMPLSDQSHCGRCGRTIIWRITRILSDELHWFISSQYLHCTIRDQKASRKVPWLQLGTPAALLIRSCTRQYW